MQAAIIPIIPQVQLKRILFATDLSKAHCATLPIISTIARRYHSELLIAHIWTPSPFPIASDPEALLMLENGQEKELSERMSKLLHRPELAGLEVQGLVETGAPAKMLHSIARERNIDLVVVNTRGRTGFNRLMLGSVAEDLFRHMNCPVLTIGPRVSRRFCHQKEIKSILYPTDLSDESRVVFPYLASIAHEYRAALKILHVLPLEVRRNPDIRALAEPLRKKMECMFAPELSPGSSAQFVIDAGNAAERILAHALEDGTDLIAMGVRKAGEIRTHFVTTVAYSVAAQAECPVITMRSSASV